MHAASRASIDSADASDVSFDGEQFGHDASIVAINTISEAAFEKVPGLGALVSGSLGILINTFWPGNMPCDNPAQALIIQMYVELLADQHSATC